MSCLFIALEKCTGLVELRDEIIAYVSNHIGDDTEQLHGTSLQEVIDLGAATEDFDNAQAYLDHMKKTSSWGGAIEIALFSHIYKRSVQVYDTNGSLLISFDVLDDMVPPVCIWYDGSHYEPLLRGPLPCTVHPVVITEPPILPKVAPVSGIATWVKHAGPGLAVLALCGMLISHTTLVHRTKRSTKHK
jgi:hypothetical protein